MLQKIKELIENEDKKNPLTDQEIAEQLKVRREQITSIRLENDIPDSRERRKPFIVKDLSQILKSDPDISERKLTKKIKDLGYNVSRHTVRQLLKEISQTPAPAKKTSREKRHEFTATDRSEETASFRKEAPRATKDFDTGDDAFSNIIGSDGSLKPQIQLAKAAVLYPPYGLHTLILGPTGVGKSDLAEAMYNFSISSGVLTKNAPFIVFNCADYADNPQLLMAQLFGYVRGAYTGAETSKQGLVERAHKGILFLDEVHRLPPEGQELLFHLIDKGRFRRLGETENTRSAEVLIIAATTENPDSALLQTFRRRIPMVIELPPLEQRPLKERYQMIVEFFCKEATKTGVSIHVNKEAIMALLLYDCPGNVGQLLSDIQVTCAKAFLDYVTKKNSNMKVTVTQLPTHTKAGLLKIQVQREKIEKLVHNDLFIAPNKRYVHRHPKEDIYTLPKEIYQYIEERHAELKSQGLSKDVINYIIGGEIEIRFRRIIKHVESTVRPLARDDLIKIVGFDVFNAVKQMLKIAQNKMGINAENLFHVLAIHLSASLDRLKQGKTILNPQLNKLKKQASKEFDVAKEMVSVAEKYLEVKFPEDEIGFVTMYLQTLTEKEETAAQGKVGVVVLSHGHVASGMVEVANKLLGVAHAWYVEMSLDEDPEKVLAKAKKVVKMADEGKGVLLLVDMGSLVTFGEIITNETGIPTRTISRCDTLLVIEAVRKAILPGVTLDELADTLEEKPAYITRLSSKSKPKTIITFCITGEGSAVKIKELITNILPDIDQRVEFIALGAKEGNIKNIISQIAATKDVVAVVGTINPEIGRIPFISIEEIIKGTGIDRLRHISNAAEKTEIKPKKRIHRIAHLLTRETTFINKKFSSKQEFLSSLSSRLHKLGYVKREFYDRLLQREDMGSTYLGNSMALPHADPSVVVKPVFVVVKLQNKIKWDDSHFVDLVFLPVLFSDSIEIIQEFYRLYQDENFIRNLRNSKTFADIKLLFANY